MNMIDKKKQYVCSRCLEIVPEDDISITYGVCSWCTQMWLHFDYYHLSYRSQLKITQSSKKRGDIKMYIKTESGSSNKYINNKAFNKNYDAINWTEDNEQLELFDKDGNPTKEARVN